MGSDEGGEWIRGRLGVVGGRGESGSTTGAQNGNGGSREDRQQHEDISEEGNGQEEKMDGMRLQ